MTKMRKTGRRWVCVYIGGGGGGGEYSLIQNSVLEMIHFRC